MNIDLTEALKTVIYYYETTIKDKITSVNYYYKSNRLARNVLIEDGVITKHHLGSILWVMSIKGICLLRLLGMIIIQNF